MILDLILVILVVSFLFLIGGGFFYLEFWRSYAKEVQAGWQPARAGPKDLAGLALEKLARCLTRLCTNPPLQASTHRRIFMIGLLIDKTLEIIDQLVEAKMLMKDAIKNCETCRRQVGECARCVSFQAFLDKGKGQVDRAR